MACQVLWVHLALRGLEDQLVSVETWEAEPHMCGGGGLPAQQALTWCTKGWLQGHVSVTKEAQVTHYVYQRTRSTGHTVTTLGQPRYTEWSTNFLATHIHDACMKLTCRVLCATSPPSLLCSCNQQNTPVPVDGTTSTVGTSLVMVILAVEVDARTPFVWTGKQKLSPGVAPTPTPLQPL